MADKELPISQRTADALADLYASRFGRIYNSRFIQRQAENHELASFLFKLGFSDELRKDALWKVSPKEVREFILKFYTGNVLSDVDGDVTDDEMEKFQRDISLALGQAILIEVEPLLSNASESFRTKVATLRVSFKDDGYYFYKGMLLTNQELVDEFGVWYNEQTGRLINMRESNEGLESEIPSAEEFLLTVPLYTTYNLDADSYVRLIYQLGVSEKLSVDSHCIDCDLPSNFKGTHSYLRTAPAEFQGYLEVVLYCTRIESHVIKFYLLARGTSITKIGQYPSLADLVQANTKKYRKVLRERYSEFHRAIGLAAHGVGVGSFVYLRRIFEDLITQAFDEAMKDANWQQSNSPGFREKRMNEKIQLLKNHLPPFLVQNRDMYGILSKGVHDLSEQECLEYFPVVQKGIELILDDEIERLERKAKTAETQKAIDAIRSKIGNNATEV